MVWVERLFGYRNIGWACVVPFVLVIMVVLLGVGLTRAEPIYHALVLPASLTNDTTIPADYRDLPRFSSVAVALRAAPKAGRYRVALLAGDYYEKITIERDYVSLIGISIAEQKPRIYFDAYAGMAGPYHRDDWGTPGSATVTVNAHNTVLSNLQIENTFDFLANDALPKEHPDRVRHSQAVALLLDVDSDLTYINDSRIDGFQDTVFADGGRSYFYQSIVSGNIDFIFGAGLAIFDQCEIRTRARGKRFNGGELQGHITAPSTNITQPFGLVFLHSRLTRELSVPDNSVSLARPWHPTTTFSDGRYADPNAIGSAIYVETWMDAHIAVDSWASMNGTARDGSKSRVFTPAESRFFERDSKGPGAQQQVERKSLSAADYQQLLRLIEHIRKLLSLEPRLPTKQ
ncbi:pectinesterase family protein [Gilvimarinus polysaccharolyticus]|uniref:pectinesterase family protein n=1 Tax=Gilvimarinus polysaccharolyticus TaxID=863921 RepID=UPI000673C273|nr:pectinesterase family protein [Gilvimarinus polysaccharolyticus]